MDDNELPRPEVTRGHATLTSAFPPSEETFTGRMMLRIAAGAWEDTEELTDEFIEMAEEFEEFFPDEAPVDPDDVPDLLARVLAEYERVVIESSSDAIALKGVLQVLGARGIVSTWGDGFDTDEAVEAAAELAREARGAGTPARGYAYVHTQDLDRLVLTGCLYIGFGIFGPGDDEASEAIGEEIAETLRAADLPVEWNGAAQSRIRCQPLLYELAIDD